MPGQAGREVSAWWARLLYLQAAQHSATVIWQNQGRFPWMLFVHRIWEFYHPFREKRWLKVEEKWEPAIEEWTACFHSHRSRNETHELVPNSKLILTIVVYSSLPCWADPSALFMETMHTAVTSTAFQLCDLDHLTWQLSPLRLKKKKERNLITISSLRIVEKFKWDNICKVDSPMPGM